MLEHKPCSSCGSSLAYQPGAETLDCPYCGATNRLEVEQRRINSHPLDQGLRLEREDAPALNDTGLSLSCPTCGAEQTLPPRVFADSCSYCDTVIVAPADSQRRFAPEAVLPFGVDRSQALGRIRKWMGSAFFAPSSLSRLARTDQRLKGIYVPYWTFDADTQSRYRGQRGTAHQVPRQVRVMHEGRMRTITRMETVMRWRPVSGQVARRFENLVIEADGGGIPELDAQDFGHWDFSNLLPYTSDVLAGYQARLYGRDLHSAWSGAQEAIEAQIRQDVRRDIGGDAQRIEGLTTHSDGEAYKLLLLPLWLTQYSYGGKTYAVAVNGRTGAVKGRRPISAVKVALVLLLALVLIAVIIGALASADQLSFGPQF